MNAGQRGGERRASAPAHRIAECAHRTGLRVGAAELLTAGGIAHELAAAPAAGDWFAGSVVAYRSPVKFSVLGGRSRSRHHRPRG